MTRFRSHLSSHELAVGLLFVAVAALACLAKAQSDTFWQLRSGLDIWHTRSIAFADPYSYTAVGLHWPNHEWLTEVLFALAHIVGGMPLVTAFCALVITAAYALSWRLTSGGFELAFGLFALAIVDTAGAWSLRPQVVTLACFMATCTLLVRDRLIWLPPLFVLWANLHAGVALGLAAIASVLIADIVATRRPPWRLAIVGATCLAATAITPMGPGLWRLLLSYSQRTKTQGIEEWLPPGLPPDYLVFWVVAVLLVGASVVRWQRVDRSTQRLTMISLMTLLLALGARRNVSVFLLAAVPALSGLLAHCLSPRRKASDFRAGNTVILSAAAVAAAAVVGTIWSRPPASLGWTPLGDRAIAAIEQCPSPIYNTLGLGGYLIWFTPSQPVFVDNRNDPYPIDLLDANLRAERTGDFLSLFGRYGVRCAVVEPGSTLDGSLQDAEDWAPVDTDWGANIYVSR